MLSDNKKLLISCVTFDTNRYIEYIIFKQIFAIPHFICMYVCVFSSSCFCIFKLMHKLCIIYFIIDDDCCQLDNLRDRLGAPISVLEQGPDEMLDFIGLIVSCQGTGAFAPEFSDLLKRCIHHDL